jgi:galactokinase
VRSAPDQSDLAGSSAVLAGARTGFERRFGHAPAWGGVAPGRVNLIGEHVDYVGGLVLPAAIDRYVGLAGEPAPEWEVESSVRGGRRYLEPLAAELGLGPQHVVAAATLVPASGLSSSAALLVAGAAGLAGPGRIGGVEAALLCQRAEQRATGVMVGVMDQFAAALGKAGHALLLDCETLAYELVPFPSDLAIAVIDSGVRRELAGTPYNQRRAEAEAALAATGRRLLDLDPGSIPADKRLRHLVTEVARVREFVRALRAGDGRRLGRLLYESHASLRDDFEVSIPVVDRLVERAQGIAGCLGARIMGAGFGGTILALLEPGASGRFEVEIGAPVTLCKTATGAFAA